MVLTRRQKERSSSSNILELKINDKASYVEVKEPAEAAACDFSEKPTHIGDSTAGDNDSGEDRPLGGKSADAFDLFVLDRTGEEVDMKITGATKGGYGQSNQLDGTAQNTKKKKRKKKKIKEKNPLTKLLPGYTAPMQLNTCSLDHYRPAGGIRDLLRRAEQTDSSTRGFVKEATREHAAVMQCKSNGLVLPSYTAAYSSFKKGTKRAPDRSAGDGWFGMVATPMTEELKADLAVIQNRNYLDPKKFYKSADKHGSVVQLGTVIEGAAEFFSSRLTKKQRRTNLTDEIMADPASADYARNKFRKMAQEKTKESKQRSRVHRPKKGKRGF